MQSTNKVIICLLLVAFLVMLFSTIGLAASDRLEEIIIEDTDNTNLASIDNSGGSDPIPSRPTLEVNKRIDNIKPPELKIYAVDDNATIEINGISDSNPGNGEYLLSQDDLLENGENVFDIRVTDSDGDVRTYELTINCINIESFKAGLSDSYPAEGYFVDKDSMTKFEIRPNAMEPETSGTTPDQLVLFFDSVNPAPKDDEGITDETMYENGGSFRFEGGAVSLIAGAIQYERISKTEIKLTIPLDEGGDSLKNAQGSTYDLEINGLQFLTLKIRSAYRQPVFENELTNTTFDYGVLNNNEVYYLAENGSGYYADFILDALPSDATSIKYRKGHRDIAQSYSKETQLELKNQGLTGLDQIPEFTGSNSTLWEINIPNAIKNELQSVSNLLLQVLRVVAWRDGARAEVSHTYYFVRDKDDRPQIEARTEDGTYGTTFGTYKSRRPQLKAKIIDQISGIGSPEDVTVKYRQLQPEESETDINNSGFSDANEMDVIDLQSRLKADGSRRKNQIVTFIPYSDLAEGEYAVKITAKDQAGNMSDSDTGTDSIEPFLFYLKTDQTGARLNNISVNSKTMSRDTESPQPVSPDSLDMYFEVYGTEDLIYGIRYLDGTNENWYVTKIGDISYITKYLRTYFNEQYTQEGENGKYTQNGTYELFIVADETSLEYGTSPSDTYDLNNNSTNDFEDIAAGWNKITDDQLINNSLTIDSYIGKLIKEAQSPDSFSIRADRRAYVYFKIEVDGQAPSYKDGSIRYVEGYGGQNEQEYELSQKIYQGQPIFRATIKDASQIDRDNITIYFTNDSNQRRVAGEVITKPEKIQVEEDTGIKHYQIEFQPVVNLTPGNYKLELEMTDQFNNQNTETFEDENLFEIITTSSGQVSFSISDGSRLDINQSSALEINITDSKLNPQDSLRVLINGSPVIATGKIVDEVTTNDSGEQQIEYKDSNYLATEHGNGNKEYYEEDGFQADGYDVLFLNENKRTVVIFSRLPLPTGRNRVKVEVIDDNGVLTTNSVEFMIDNYRSGFGFGRLLPQTSQ